MRPLAQEQNIEVLREYSILVTQAAERLAVELDLLKNERVDARATQEFLSSELQDHLTRLQKKFFGFGREKNPETNAHRPIGHDNQACLVFGERAHSESTSTDETSGSQAAVSEQEIHDFDRGALVAESLLRGFGMEAGADAWRKIAGLTEDTVEITVTERTYRKVVHRQTKYRLKDEYNTTGKEVIITAPGPVKVKPGMTYSVDFALAVVSDKYEYHLPLERQRRKMEEAGLQVDVKTLYTLCEAVAEHCQSILPGIRRDIQRDYCAVHLDETPWRILSNGTLGQMWVMSNRIGSFYQFEPTRSGKVAVEMLSDYQGCVVTDAYGGYNRLAPNRDIRVQHCWSHARREFYERFDDWPVECGRALELIDRIFALERDASTVEGLRIIRAEKSRSAVAEFRDFLFETKPRFLPGDGISKAINYCLNHWTGLTHFLRDSTAPLTNNDAERALRHVVIGRKNFLGSQTINGADTAAVLYTVIETAKKCITSPKEYLKYLITERWHKREPMTPKEYADKKLGANTRIKWPDRSAWQIP